jgi:hypothetical protein
VRHLSGTVPTVSDYAQRKTCCNCWARILLTGEGAALTRCTVASAHTVAAHASALLQQTIITHARGAVSRLYAACAQYTVIRRAVLETGGLTVVSAYLPSVSVGRPCPVLGTRSPPTRI